MKKKQRALPATGESITDLFQLVQDGTGPERENLKRIGRADPEIAEKAGQSLWNISQ